MPIESEFMNNSFGVVTGTSSTLPFPSVNISWLRIKAYPSNAVTNYIGVQDNCVFPLNPGDDTGWFPVDHLENISYKGSGTHFGYWFEN